MKIKRFVSGWLALACIGSSQAALLSESFGDITTLAASGWVQTNNSAPIGNDWFQGNSGTFASQAGAPDAYIGNNFNSTSGISGLIDAWLISPALSLPGGGILTFYTRIADPGFSDRLEILFSANSGSSTSDFTTLLATIGDAATPYSSLDWQAFSVTLPSAVSGRFALRYTVADALDADYIGIDTVDVNASVNAVPEPPTGALFGVGIAAMALRRRCASGPRRHSPST